VFQTPTWKLFDGGVLTGTCALTCLMTRAAFGPVGFGTDACPWTVQKALLVSVAGVSVPHQVTVLPL